MRTFVARQTATRLIPVAVIDPGDRLVSLRNCELRRPLVQLAVAAVALPLGCLGLGPLPAVGGQGAADIIALLDSPVSSPTDEAFVAFGGDQFTLSGSLRHVASELVDAGSRVIGAVYLYLANHRTAQHGGRPAAPRHVAGRIDGDACVQCIAGAGYSRVRFPPTVRAQPCPRSTPALGRCPHGRQNPSRGTACSTRKRSPRRPGWTSRGPETRVHPSRHCRYRHVHRRYLASAG